MMGLSSNFGNMFSMIGAVLYLPFFPMLPGQILLNNLLYDASQLSIPTDNVDQEYLRKPRHWDMKFIKYFMIIFGLISSVFDILTFVLLFGFFGLKDSVFQAGWFIESLLTQILVIYIIRTKKIPFLQSRPSKFLAATTLLIISFGIMIISTRIGHFFGFGDLPWPALIYIFGLVLIYLLIVEIAKQIFYRLLHTKDDARIITPAPAEAK
jgi:Mg2+-importing ATPase